MALHKFCIIIIIRALDTAETDASSGGNAKLVMLGLGHTDLRHTKHR